MNTKITDMLQENSELKAIRDAIDEKAKEIAKLMASGVRQMQAIVMEVNGEDLHDAVVVKMIADQLYQDVLVFAMDELNANWREEAINELCKVVIQTLSGEYDGDTQQTVTFKDLVTNIKVDRKLH